MATAERLEIEAGRDHRGEEDDDGIGEVRRAPVRRRG
jgi:hypothetical protein